LGMRVQAKHRVAVLGKTLPRRSMKRLRSSSSWKFRLRSIPRQMIWCSAPGASMRACLGIGERVPQENQMARMLFLTTYIPSPNKVTQDFRGVPLVVRKEVVGPPTRPPAHLVKDAGMVRGESAKQESPAYNGGVEMAEQAKRESGRKKAS
jgi:hypothetical protein